MTVSMNVSTNQKDNALNSMLMGQSNAESSAFDAELNQQMQASRQDLAEATHGYDDFQQQHQDVQTQSRLKATQLRDEAIQREQTKAQALQDERMVKQGPADSVEPQLQQTSAVEELNVDATAADCEDLSELTDSQSDLLLSMIEKSNALQPRVLELSNQTAAVSLTAETGEAAEGIDAIPAIFSKPLLEKPTAPSDPRPVETSAMASDDAFDGGEPPMDDLALDAASYWRLKQHDAALQVKSSLTAQLDTARQQALDKAKSDSKTGVEKNDGSQLMASSNLAKTDPLTMPQHTAEAELTDETSHVAQLDSVVTASRQVSGLVQQDVKRHESGSEAAKTSTSEPVISLAAATDATKSTSASSSQHELKLKLRGEPLFAQDKEQRLVDTPAPVDGQPPVTALFEHDQSKPIEAEQFSAATQQAPQPLAVVDQATTQADAADPLSSTMLQASPSSAAVTATTGSSTESVSRADAKPTFAEFMQNSNQQEQQSASNQQSKAEQHSFTTEVVAQPRTEVPVATVEVAVGRQPSQMVDMPAHGSTLGVTSASSHAVHTHVNKLTDTLKAAEMTTQQQALDLQQPTAANKLLERVMYQVQQKIQSAEVQLHPEDLGAMQIKLSLQQDQVTVQFLVQNGNAKDAVEQQLSRLKDMLQQQGMQLADGQVEQRQQGQQGDSSQRHSARSGSTSPSDAEQVGVLQQGQVQVRISERAVDYYA